MPYTSVPPATPAVWVVAVMIVLMMCVLVFVFVVVTAVWVHWHDTYNKLYGARSSNLHTMHISSLLLWLVIVLCVCCVWVLALLLLLRAGLNICSTCVANESCWLDMRGRDITIHHNVWH